MRSSAPAPFESTDRLLHTALQLQDNDLDTTPPDTLSWVVEAVGGDGISSNVVLEALDI